MRLVTSATVRSRMPQLIDNGGEGTLVCPHCGGSQLHQSRAEVFFRGEDQSDGIYVGVSGEAELAMVKRGQTGNPSPRRDGLRIWFTCEGCPQHSSLVVIQHKGDTLVHWEMAQPS